MNFYAENALDRFIRDKFFTDLNYRGLLIEVGAGPPEFYSVSKHFRETGWRCMGFEPNPKFFQAHKNLGHEVYQLAISDYVGKSKFTIVNTGEWEKDHEGISYSALSVRYDCVYTDREEIDVEVERLDNILDKFNVKDIDILVVDVEGWELEVVRGLNLTKNRPKLVILENYQYKNEYNQYMDSMGYQLLYSILHNFFFIPK